MLNVLIDILRNGKFAKCFVEGLDEYQGHVEIIYPRGLGYLFTNTMYEIWDFFEYLLMILGSIKMLWKPLVTPFSTAM